YFMQSIKNSPDILSDKTKKKVQESYFSLQERLRKLENDFFVTKEKLKMYGSKDCSENSDWILLNEYLLTYQAQIAVLKDKMLAVSREADKTITYRLLETGEEKTVQLTNGETDPDQGIISRVSPLGMALNNKEVGAIAESSVDQKFALGSNWQRAVSAEGKEKLRRNLFTAAFSTPKKSTFQFIVGIPPVIGGEARLARIIDYLYTQSDQIINFSKKEYLSLGPLRIITLQNSYKNEKFLSHLSGKFLTLNNGCVLDFPTQKISSLKVKKSLISLDEILIEQRSNLGQSGAKDNKLQLKEVKVEPLAISSGLNVPKLVTKIKS
ncbi:8690_t:CDS:2, partial [Scutellospora calospora]